MSIIKLISSLLPEKDKRPMWMKVCVNIFSGTCAGINVTLVGHPFDTLKVRLQTQPSDNKVYSGLKDCFVKTIRWEGIRGLYAGVQSPLLGQMFFRANLFTAFGEAKRYFSQDGKRKLTFAEYFYCGGIGWGLTTFVECPIDVFKTQLQIQIIKSKTIKDFVPEYKGFFDCMSKVLKANGIKGAYMGLTPHLLRNIPAGAVHLGSFEVIRVLYSEKLNKKVHEIPMIYNMIAGSTGGVLYWLLFFPFDVVKSSMQADNLVKSNRKFSSTIQCFQKLYQEGGISRFYKGFSPCLLRAIPANAVLLYTNSYISEHL